MGQLDPLIPRAHIACFSMEIALRPEMHTHARGLGVRAGDNARSCAGLEMPVVLVALFSHAGWIWMVKETLSKIVPASAGSA